MKDGWHIVCGYDCYIEDNCIMRATKQDHNGYNVHAYPYRKAEKKYGGGWDIAKGISVNAFRSAYNRHTVDIF